jgi:trehalose-6-phosphate synthase
LIADTDFAGRPRVRHIDHEPRGSAARRQALVARDDEDGVLVLSALAGAAQELREALIINPYDIDGFVDALVRAMDMPHDERRARMRSMRRTVAGQNVFDWASDILEGLESLWTKPLQYAARAPEDAPV